MSPSPLTALHQIFLGPSVVACLVPLMLAAGVNGLEKSPSAQSIHPNASSVRNLLSTAVEQLPIERYYLPLKETDTLAAMDVINGGGADSPIVSITNLAIAADNTIIWYDHHEDGYENDILDLANLQSTTQIFGDQDCANGYAPGTTCTNDADDVLTAGMAINIINDVPIPRTSAILYDGGDKIDASFPLAITRGAYPHDGGSDNPLFAGAVEVLNTKNYGIEFITPVGTNTPGDNNAFQQTELHIMAQFDGTVVTLTKANGDPPTQSTINAGESLRITGAGQGDAITTEANYPVQAHLITGHIGSDYELRWFSLLPTSQWDNTYYTPVGEDASTFGTPSQVSAYIYNPSTSPITVFFNRGTGTSVAGGNFVVNAKSTYRHQTEDYLGQMTGYEYYTSSETDLFFGVVVVDTDSSVSDWQAYDWGHTLVPQNELTPQIIIGEGRRCVDPTAVGGCGDGNDGRNYVYLTPASDAKVWVDYNGDGVVDDTYQVKRLNTLQLADTVDDDMSGAYIFATSPTAERDGESVNFAAVWGQLPYDSTWGQQQSVQLDMGTWLNGLDSLQVFKFCSLSNDRDGVCDVSPGDELTCTIKLVNAGERIIESITLQEVLNEDVIYSDGTTTFELKGSSPTNTPVPIADQPGTGTNAFPLGGTGTTLTGLSLAHFDELLVTYKIDVKYPGDLSLDFNGIITDSGVASSSELGLTASFTSRIEVRVGCVPSSAPTNSPGPSSLPTRTPTVVPSATPSDWVPIHPLVPSSNENSVCRNVTVTATQTFEMREYAFWVNSTDCLKVDVQMSIDGGIPFSACLGYVLGAGPYNATYIPSTFCAMQEIIEGENITMTIKSEPSDRCGDQLYAYANYPSRYGEYTTEYTECI